MPIATVAAIIKNEEGKILLTRRNVEPFKGQWCLPGGQIDEFENTRDAAVREAKEETGLDFEAEFFGYADEVIPEINWHAIVMVFTGKGQESLPRKKGKSRILHGSRWRKLGLCHWRLCIIKFLKSMCLKKRIESFEMSKNDKIEYLFDLYVRNWQSFTSKTKHVFVCPLCLKEFTKSEMLNKVSEEHIIPSSLGGNFTTLTCKKCNNEGGSELDAHVIQRIRIEQGDVPINSRVTICDEEVGADIYFSDEKNIPNKILVISKQSNPKSINSVQDVFNENPKEVSLNLKFGYNERASLIGLVRIAYLMMFRRFGYAYILQDFANQIRQQIKQPFEESPVLESVRWQLEDLPFRTNAITVIKEPPEFRSFYVIIKLTDKAKHLSGVILPGVGQHNTNIYTTLKELENKETFKVIPIAKMDFNHNDIWNPLEVWNTIFTN